MAIRLQKARREPVVMSALESVIQQESVSTPSFGIVWEAESGQAYTQEAFRYFLGLEMNRSEMSARPFLLVLVYVRDAQGRNRPIAPALAARLFSTLFLGLRETDFLGWLRDGRVAGAVLTQRPGGELAGMTRHVQERVVSMMLDGLPKDAAAGVHVRVRRLPSRQKGRM